MKMKKIGQFFRKYGFYVAIGVVCIGALTAIFILPTDEGNIKNQPNPYAKNEQVDGNIKLEAEKDIIIDEEDKLDQTDDVMSQEDEVKSIPSNEVTTKGEAEKGKQVTKGADQDKEITTETFESTTVTGVTEPFFADGDTLAWPVVGEVVVPYTDESTKYWFSESLNQTMRTFGICIGAEENTEVKAAARGTVTKVVEDSSSILEAGMPYVGKLMVIDHGNGYVSLYGFEGGEVKEDLVGQVVNEGDVLGTVGSPKGAFINEGSNLYLQVMHNDKVVNPMNFLESMEDTAEIKAESIDIGFSAQ